MQAAAAGRRHPLGPTSAAAREAMHQPAVRESSRAAAQQAVLNPKERRAAAIATHQAAGTSSAAPASQASAAGAMGRQPKQPSGAPAVQKAAAPKPAKPAAPAEPAEPPQPRYREDGSLVKSCNCRKSKCLKLYCDCFAANVFCSGCACTVGLCPATCRSCLPSLENGGLTPPALQNCQNLLRNAAAVEAVKAQIRERDPEAFAPKVIKAGEGAGVGPGVGQDGATHKRGCHCKKSR